MADPSSVFHYEDMYSDEIWNMLDNQNPTLEDLTAQEVPMMYPASSSVHDYDNNSTDQIVDTIDPLDDPVIWDFGDFETEAAGDCDQTTSFGVPEGIMNNNQSDQTFMGTDHGSSSENSIPLSVWPCEPVPFGCSCCQVLREIVHTKGANVTKLEIHGRLGMMICHAILDQPGGSSTDAGRQYQMFDFCKMNIEEVKQFLTQYCTHRSQAGYMMIKDPLSVFYEALFVGFVWDENMYNPDFTQPSSSSVGNNINNQDRPRKPPLALQRVRTRNLTLKEMENYFRLPIEEAAKKMELSATVVKKICRKNGLTRWPHRKIQSMEKQISILESKLNGSNDPQERARFENGIQSLQRQIAKFGGGAQHA